MRWMTLAWAGWLVAGCGINGEADTGELDCESLAFLPDGAACDSPGASCERSGGDVCMVWKEHVECNDEGVLEITRTDHHDVCQNDCPDELPAEGESCAAFDPCSYGDCTATCESGGWSVTCPQVEAELTCATTPLPSPPAAGTECFDAQALAGIFDVLPPDFATSCDNDGLWCPTVASFPDPLPNETATITVVDGPWPSGQSCCYLTECVDCEG